MKFQKTIILEEKEEIKKNIKTGGSKLKWLVGKSYKSSYVNASDNCGYRGRRATGSLYDQHQKH